MSLRYYYTSAASCASFLALYKYFNPSLTIKFIPEFKNLSNPKRVEWSSRTNSSVHAVLVSMLCLYCLIYEDDISLDPIWGESDLVRMTCAIVVGYMCSDVLIVLFHYSEIGEIFFLFHHAASIYAFCFAMTYGALLWFANVRLIAEFSTPFVNKRWFLDVLGYKKYSPPVVLNGVSMTVMFFFVRVVSVPFYWLKVYSIYGSEKCDSLGKIWYVLISSCLILDIINLYWFLKITQGIIKVLRTTNQNSDITQYCHNIFGKSDPYTYKMSGNSFHNDSIYYREGSLKHRPSKFNSQLDGYHDSVSPIARLSS